MPQHCCFTKISQLVHLRGFNMQNLLFLWPPYVFHRKNKRHETLSHSLVRMEVMLPSALAPVPASKTKPPLLNQTEGKKTFDNYGLGKAPTEVSRKLSTNFRKS